MFHIALFEPCIAPNTGNIIRLAANIGCSLHLIEPLGFDMDEKKLRRAGLDYHEYANVQKHENFEAFRRAMTSRRIIACTTKGNEYHTGLEYQDHDVLLFGAETHGLSEEALAAVPEGLRVRIPMLETSRSLNLSNAVAVISYEACRQLGFAGLI